MRCKCGHGHMMGHGHGHGKGACMWGGIAFTVAMMLYTAVATWLLFRMTAALETMAMAKTLDELEDRLSDAEKADLEGRIREDLF